MKPPILISRFAISDRLARSSSRFWCWRFERFPMPYEYYRIQAGAEREPGIDGGLAAPGIPRSAKASR